RSGRTAAFRTGLIRVARDVGQPAGFYRAGIGRSSPQLGRVFTPGTRPPSQLPAALSAGGSGAPLRSRVPCSIDRAPPARRISATVPGMASRIGDMIIDCTDPDVLARFWCAVLGYEEYARDETGVAIRGSRAAPTILLIRVPEPKTVKNRIHFDVCPTDRDQA